MNTLSRKELMSLPADRLCMLYREQVVRLYGAERAEKSRVDQHAGWFYVEIAARYPDGSIGLGGRVPKARRKREIVEMILNLAKREPSTDRKEE